MECGEGNKADEGCGEERVVKGMRRKKSEGEESVLRGTGG
jgi:hypothetical protein